MKLSIATVLFTALTVLASAQVWAMDIEVKGLFKGQALLVIDGKQRLLKEGSKSPEGVRLLSSNSKMAVIEVNGKRLEVGLSRTISSRFSEAEKSEVRLAPGYGGHYITPGRINGFPVEFLIDTGATSVAMNLPTAKRLGINYRAGKKIKVSTANGVVDVFQVKLDSVSVGVVKVNNILGTVHIGDSPSTVLLGNTYLNRVEMKREDGVLVLQSKY